MNSLTIALLALNGCLVASQGFFGQEEFGSIFPGSERLALEESALGGSLERFEPSFPRFSAEFINEGPIIEEPFGFSAVNEFPSLRVGSGFSPIEVESPAIEIDVPDREFNTPEFYSGRSYLEGSINCGPSPRPSPIRYLPEVVLPVREGAIRVLPAPPLPAPVVVANKCICKKVVEKPQLFQRLIVSQKNQRFLKRTYVPRTEKVEYSAKPRC